MPIDRMPNTSMTLMHIHPIYRAGTHVNFQVTHQNHEFDGKTKSIKNLLQLAFEMFCFFESIQNLQGKVHISIFKVHAF